MAIHSTKNIILYQSMFYKIPQAQVSIKYKKFIAIYTIITKHMLSWNIIKKINALNYSTDEGTHLAWNTMMK